MVTTDPKTAIDESPIVVAEIEVDGVYLVASEPLHFKVTFDDDPEEPIFDLEGPLNIYLFAASRAELIDILVDHLQFLWRDFAVGDQSKISGDAQELGAEMRRLFVKAPDAP